MSQTCTFVTQRVLRPGTGVFAPAPDDSWDATAVSEDEVNPDLPWNYSFRPRRDSVFMTGLFDRRAGDAPAPSSYILAIEFEFDRFYVRRNGQRFGPWLHRQPQHRIIMARTATGRYEVVSGGRVVWSRPV